MTAQRRARCFEYMACLSISFMSWGVLLSFGTFLPHILDRFGESRSKSSAVHSVAMGVTLIIGVFSGALIKKVGTGVTTFIGAFCLAGGFIVSYFATELTMLYATIGVAAGIGCSFTYMSAVVSTGRMFEERRQTVFLSIQNVAGGVGGMVWPYFIDWLIGLYGINGAFLVLGGIFLNTFACATLLFYSNRKGLSSNKDIKTETDNEGADIVRIPMKSLTYVIMLICVTVGTSNLVGVFAVIMDIYTFKQLSHAEGLVCLVVFNVVTTLARFMPILINLCSKNPLLMLILSTSIGLMGSLTILLSSSFPLIAFGTGAFGVSDGATMGSLSVIIFKCVVPEYQSLSYGLILTAIGVISAGMGPLYGGIYDGTKSYFIVLIISSSAYLISVVSAAVCVMTYKRFATRGSPTLSSTMRPMSVDVFTTDNA